MQLAIDRFLQDRWKKKSTLYTLLCAVKPYFQFITNQANSVNEYLIIRSKSFSLRDYLDKYKLFRYFYCNAHFVMNRKKRFQNWDFSDN